MAWLLNQSQSISSTPVLAHWLILHIISFPTVGLFLLLLLQTRFTPSLLHSCFHPSAGTLRWVCWLDQSPESSYLDFFFYSMHHPAAESSVENQPMKLKSCFLLFFNLDLSFFLLRLCVYVWHSWWLHCVRCAVSSGKSTDWRTASLTSEGRNKLAGGYKSLWLKPAPLWRPFSVWDWTMCAVCHLKDAHRLLKLKTP